MLRFGFIGAVALGVVVAPVVAVILSQRSDDPDTFATHATPVSSPPTPRTVTDERTVRIVATAIAGPQIAGGPARGTVTSVAVKPGAALADGAVVLQVDGVDRIGFASSIPFYRPISPNTEGADVAELHRLLVLKGALAAMPANPGLATFATGQAIGDFAASIGAARATTFDPGWVVWLPEPGLVVETITVKVGQPAPAQGSVIITTPGRVTSAKLASANQEPLTFAAGVEYVAIVDGQEFAIDTATQSIAAAGLPRLRSPKETERDGIPATTRRKTPLQALAVPSSAVMTNERGALCIWIAEGKEYRPVTVTIAGARAGVTNIASGLEPSQQVLSNPAQVLDEPQCP